jgi:hypothetical protein
MGKRNVLIVIVVGVVVLLFYVSKPLPPIAVGVSGAEASEVASYIRHSTLSLIPDFLKQRRFRQAWSQAKLFATLRVKRVAANPDQTIDVEVTAMGVHDGAYILKKQGSRWVGVGVREAHQ